MKIVRNQTAIFKPSKSGKVEVGTVFTGKVGDVRSTFLKAYNSIVCLEDPKHIWTSGNPIIADYKEVNAVLHVDG